MPLRFIHDDITKLSCDAIVDFASVILRDGSGVNTAILAAAGPKLKRACARLGSFPIGMAKITKGFNLPCRFVIHTIYPKWRGGNHNEEAYLRSCYRETLALADKIKCESVAFPVPSWGDSGYPGEKALQIAIDEISHFLLFHDMSVIIAVHDKSAFRTGKRLIEDIAEYIDSKYDNNLGVTTAFYRRKKPASFSVMSQDSFPVDGFGADTTIVLSRDEKEESDQQENSPPSNYNCPAEQHERPAVSYAGSAELETTPSPACPTSSPSVIKPYSSPPHQFDAGFSCKIEHCLTRPPTTTPQVSPPAPTSFGSISAHPGFELDEGFSDMLLRKIDEKGMTDVECYKKANIDRKLFSKIRSDPKYKPSKTTAVAFAIALELTLEESETFLKKAGFALSHSYLFDVIIEYFIKNHNYNIYEINEALFEYDQALLGAGK